VWDRWLLVLLMFATLRSPLLIGVFVLHAALSKAQFAHPISAITPVGDELPVRALGMVFGAAAWNVLPEARVFRTGGGRWLSQPWPTVSTGALVFSALCLIGVNYGFAAVGKLMLGESPADWIRSSHMENLFVAAHLNGWLSQLSLAQVFEWANWIRVASVPISLATVIIELSMFFLLVH